MLRKIQQSNFVNSSAMNLAIAGCASGIALGWEGKYTLTNAFGDE